MLCCPICESNHCTCEDDIDERKCKDCGVTFYRHEEEDNEEYCLKCEAKFVAEMNQKMDY